MSGESKEEGGGRNKGQWWVVRSVGPVRRTRTCTIYNVGEPEED